LAKMGTLRNLKMKNSFQKHPKPTSPFLLACILERLLFFRLAAAAALPLFLLLALGQSLVT
jgi:hypothetical protein